MNRVAAAGFSIVAALCSACSEADAPTAEGAVQGPLQAAPPLSESPRAASSGASSAPGTSLGRGTALAGSVSGLTGEVSAFQVEVTDTSTVVQIAADVLFAFDSATLGGEAPAQLRRAADLIRQGGPGAVPVEGHTDSKGADAYNDDLSRRRAEAVAAWLASEGGVEESRLEPQGRGEREPVAPNAEAGGQDSPSGRARNRRVVLTIPRP